MLVLFFLCLFIILCMIIFFIFLMKKNNNISSPSSIDIYTHLNDIDSTVGHRNNSFNTFGRTNIFPLLNDKKWTKYVDKLQLKELCTQKGIKTFQTLKILSEPKELYHLQEKLPNDFIIKSNKGSGQNYIIRNSKHMSSKEYQKKIDNALHFLKNWKNPGYGKNEKQYNFTKPQLYVEELIHPIPNDIKVFVYQKCPTVMMIKDTSGKLKIYSYKIHKDYTITHIKDYFWKQCVEKEPSETIKDIQKKGKLKKLIDTILKFNVDIPLVRIDLYWYKDEFYCGEVTLSSGNFTDKFNELCARQILSTQ